MDMIKESDFRKEIKSSPRNAYLFFGEEDYLKSFCVDFAASALCPDETFSVFNLIKFDSFSYTADALTNAMQSFPMMADRKLIIINGLDIDSMRQGDITALLESLSNLSEYDFNTVILNVASDALDYGILPKRPSSVLNTLSEHLTPVYFERSTPAKLSAWAKKHFEHNSVTSDDTVCAFVAEHCKRDMFIMSSEIDKASYYVLYHGRNNVTREDILNVSSVNPEYDTFAFANALISGKRNEALAILANMKFKRIEPVVIFSELSSTYCNMAIVKSLSEKGFTASEIASKTKLHEYRVGLLLRNSSAFSVDRLRSAIKLCADADRQIKLSSNGYYEIEKLLAGI